MRFILAINIIESDIHIGQMGADGKVPVQVRLADSAGVRYNKSFIFDTKTQTNDCDVPFSKNADKQEFDEWIADKINKGIEENDELEKVIEFTYPGTK